MSFRHRAREVGLQILYHYDETKSSPQEQIAELEKHFDHFKVPAEVREFAAELVAGTVTHLTELDSLLEQQASNWRVARMALIDRSLLRMAAYEMTYMKETPHSVVIDEAIELAKQFGTAETPAFVNGVLDGIRKGAGLPDPA